MTEISSFGDGVILLTLVTSCVAALAIGYVYDDWRGAWIGGAILSALGLLAFWLGRGRPLGWMTLTACNVAAVVLHIHLARGSLEFHFGVFVLLGMLLVYRDWRPVVLAASLFAVHHIVFDRLQAFDVGVYCTPQPSLLRVLLHEIYVVAQTAIEIIVALGLRRAAIESGELRSIVRSVDRGELICLDVADMDVRSPAPRMLKQALARMADAISDVSRASASIGVASTRIAESNLDWSQRTEVQAVKLEQTVASMNILRGTVTDTAATAIQANELARSASSTAGAGGTAVATAVEAMAEIGRASSRIADINAVIDSIAFQTNILALNAAVEAARAGEHGRGFAVVAAEVRTLAQRSAASAREIKSLIDDSVGRVELGERQVGSAGANMNDIVSQTQRVSELMGAISSSTAAQSEGVNAVGEAVTELGTVTRLNSTLVAEGVAAAISLTEQSAQLNAVVQRFWLGSRTLVGDGAEGGSRGVGPASDRPGSAASRPAPVGVGGSATPSPTDIAPVAADLPGPEAGAPSALPEGAEPPALERIELF